MPVPRRRVQGHGGWLWSGRPGDAGDTPIGLTNYAQDIVARSEARHGNVQTDLGGQEPLFRDGMSPATAIQTDNVEYAAQLLGTCRESDGKGNCKAWGYYVELQQPRQVSTLLDKLAEIAKDAKAKGADAPHYDLCKVSVPRTNLFCVDTKGRPRRKMPQLTGTPKPGSPADFMAKDERGEVDLGPAFTAHLQNLGFTVEQETVDASVLRASQDELDGTKTAKFMDLILDGTIDPLADYWRVWTTGDDYIIDGHHRWSGTVGAEFKGGNAVPIAVNRVKGLGIIQALDLAVAFTAQMGIPPLDFGQFQQVQEQT